MAKDVVKSQQPKVIPLYKKSPFWISSAAAIFIGIIITIGFGENTPSNENPLFALNDVSSTEIINYVNEHIEEYEIEEIASILPNEVLDATESYELLPIEVKEKPKKTEPAVNMQEINSEEILEYLDEEGIELFDLDEIELI